MIKWMKVKLELIGDDNYQYNMISKMLKDNNSLN